MSFVVIHSMPPPQRRSGLFGLMEGRSIVLSQGTLYANISAPRGAHIRITQGSERSESTPWIMMLRQFQHGHQRKVWGRETKQYDWECVESSRPLGCHSTKRKTRCIYNDRIFCNNFHARSQGKERTHGTSRMRLYWYGRRCHACDKHDCIPDQSIDLVFAQADQSTTILMSESEIGTTHRNSLTCFDKHDGLELSQSWVTI